MGARRFGRRPTVLPFEPARWAGFVDEHPEGKSSTSFAEEVLFGAVRGVIFWCLLPLGAAVGCIPEPVLRPRDASLADTHTAVEVDASVDVVDAGWVDTLIETSDARMDASTVHSDATLADTVDVMLDVPMPCNAPQLRCGGRCVDMLEDPLHCGACDRVCASADGGTARCEQGVCVRACAEGEVWMNGMCRVIPAARLVAPLSGQLLTGRTPTLRWELTAPSDGAVVEICRDRLCASVVRTLPSSGAQTLVSPPLEAGVWFWRVRARAGTSVSRQSSATWYFSVVGNAARSVSYGVIPDFDGDGDGDMVVGAGGVTPRGVAYRLVRRSNGDIALSQTWRAPNSTDMAFGHSLGAAGDVNGDGYVDLVICGFASATYRGACYVYQGSSNGPEANPTTILTGTLIGNFGWSVAAAGDVDGDGYGDLVVGAPNVEMETGRVALYRGGPTGVSSTPTLTMEGASTFTGLGFTVAAGDLNGDGRSEIIAGGNRAGGGRGTVVILSGAAPLEARNAFSVVAPSGGQFGYTVSVVGDVDGDGFPDLAASAPFAPPSGEIYVLRGGEGALPTRPTWTLRPSGELGASAGVSMAAAADLDGDGLADFLVGAPLSSRGSVALTGSIGVVSGRRDSTPALTWSLAGAGGAGSLWGVAPSSAVDIDRDGRRDILVGSGEEAGQPAQLQWIRGLPSGDFARTPTGIPAPESGPVGFGRAIAQ